MTIQFNFTDNQDYTLSLQGMDVVAQTNLTTLFRRRRGERLIVDSTTGLLRVPSSFKEKFSTFVRKKEEDEKVRGVVNTTLQALNQIGNLLSPEEGDTYKKFVIKLFDREGETGIGRYTKRLFDKVLTQGDNCLSLILLPQNRVRLRLEIENSEQAPLFVDIPIIGARPQDDSGTEEMVTRLLLSNSVTQNNLYRLLKRKRGREGRYYVDEEGKLQKNKNCLKGTPVCQQSLIKQAVEHVIADIERQIQPIAQDNETQNPAIRLHAIAVRYIFFNSPLQRMSSNLYYRGAIEEGSKLEGVLFPEMAKLKKELSGVLAALAEVQDIKKNDKASPDTLPHLKETAHKALLNLLTEEAKFAARLNKKALQPLSGGTGGARAGRGRHNRRLIVVKPGDEGPIGKNNRTCSAAFKRWLNRRPEHKDNAEELSEQMSWQMDMALDLGLKPPTQVDDWSHESFVGNEQYKSCSVQAFMEGCESLGDYLELPSALISLLPRSLLRWYYSRPKQQAWLKKKLPQEVWEKMAILQFLTGDRDGHCDNFLVKTHLDNQAFDFKKLSEEQKTNFFSNFFRDNKTQQILDMLLDSYTVTEGEEGALQTKRITVASTDGGWTFPHRHLPNKKAKLRKYEVFDYLDKETAFSQESFSYYSDTENVETSTNFIHGLIKMSYSMIHYVVKNGFMDNFWAEEKNRAFLLRWLFATPNSTQKIINETCLLGALMSGTGAMESYETGILLTRLRQDLPRIHDIIWCSLESWRILMRMKNKHIENDTPTRIHELLDCCTVEDFNTQLHPSEENPSLEEEGFITLLENILQTPEDWIPVIEITPSHPSPPPLQNEQQIQTRSEEVRSQIQKELSDYYK